MPEELEKGIRDLPRDKDVIELFKKLSGPDSLPTRSPVIGRRALDHHLNTTNFPSGRKIVSGAY